MHSSKYFFWMRTCEEVCGDTCYDTLQSFEVNSSVYQSTVDFGLLYGYSSNFELVGYSDNDSD